MQANHIRIAIALLALAAALVAPFAVGPFWMALLTQILIFGLLALAVDLLLGHAGLFSICHASFFAVSAYTVAILQVRYGQPTLVAAPAGIVAGTLLAVLYGSAVRTRGVYFILITIAMGYIIWGAMYRWASFTGGDNGITNVPAPAIGNVVIQSQIAYYYFVLAVVIACAVGCGILVRSPFGLSLRGIKGSESRMQSLGYRTTAHLYAAFVISGAIASLAGVLYVYYNRFVNPVAASFNISIEVALMAIVGGSGTIIGPFIGAGVLLGMRNWVSSFFELHAAVMGLVFIVTILWAPTGIMGIIRRLFVPARRRGEQVGMTVAAVEVRDLRKVFGGLRAVDGVTLAVAPGERRALIGPNGAGKTTLFHCITGTLQATSGQVNLYGHDVTQAPEHRRTKLGMGRTFQITNVFADLTLSENMALAIMGTDRRKWVLNRPVSAFPAFASRCWPDCGSGSRRTCRPPGHAPILRGAPPARVGTGARHATESAVPRRALCRVVAERAAAHLRHGAGTAARHHCRDDRARHGRSSRHSRPRHRVEPRPSDGGGHARASPGRPQCPRRVFRPCLKRCSPSPTSTPTTATAMSCRGSACPCPTAASPPSSAATAWARPRWCALWPV